MASSERALADCQGVITATAAQLEVLHALLESFWTRATAAGAAPSDVTWRLRFATAVAEIGANVVGHAYPVGAEPRRLRVRLRAFSHRIEARFTDGGEPFTQHDRLSAARPDGRGTAGRLDDYALLAEGGYGLQIAREAVDEVSYVRTPTGRNVWRFVKRF